MKKGETEVMAGRDAALAVSMSLPLNPCFAIAYLTAEERREYPPRSERRKTQQFPSGPRASTFRR